MAVSIPSFYDLQLISEKNQNCSSLTKLIESMIKATRYTKYCLIDFTGSWQIASVRLIIKDYPTNADNIL